MERLLLIYTFISNELTGGDDGKEKLSVMISGRNLEMNWTPKRTHSHIGEDDVI